MTSSTGADDLWDEFHRVVNMTSRELEQWLLTEEAGEDADLRPGETLPPTGAEVLAILGKRKVDLEADDLEVMARVVATVHRERGEDLEPAAGEDGWRRRMMSMGHDPLRPAGDVQSRHRRHG
jgi:hypothetical protein